MRFWGPVCCGEERAETKAKFSIYWSIYVPILTYGHMRRVVTKRMKLQLHSAKMNLLHMVAWLFLRDNVTSMDIQEVGPWMPPGGRFLGMPHWEDAPGQLEVLYFLAGLRLPWYTLELVEVAGER